MVKKMSDPVTNAEVEDVLSSIRRLVSEDKRPLHVSQSDRASDRLVLTPALRVAEDTGTEAEDAPVPQASEDAHPDAQSALDVDRAPPADQDDVGHGTADHEAADHDATDHDATERETLSYGEDDASFDDPAHDYSDDPYGFLEDESEEGKRLVDHEADVQVHDAQHALPHEEYDKPASDDEVSREQAADDQDFDAAQDLQHQDGAQDHDDAQDQEGTQGTPDQTVSPTSKADALRAKIEELEAAIGGIGASWNASGAPSDAIETPLSKDAMAWEDASPEDAIRPQIHSYDAENETQEDEDVSIADDVDAVTEHPDEPPAAPQSDIAAEDQFPPAELEAEPAPEDDGFDYGADTQLLDEEALRDMVSEIVRAELQGALGEKITRNVRKLVRREIHRALTAQDLE